MATHSDIRARLSASAWETEPNTWHVLLDGNESGWHLQRLALRGYFHGDPTCLWNIYSPDSDERIYYTEDATLDEVLDRVAGRMAHAEQLQAAQERLARYRARKLGAARWEILVDGKPCGLTVERRSDTGSRWEWMVLDRERTVVGSARRGGVRAVLKELARAPEIIAKAGTLMTSRDNRGMARGPDPQ
jgi:hypothetical protein